MFDSQLDPCGFFFLSLQSLQQVVPAYIEPSQDTPKLRAPQTFGQVSK